MRIAHVVTYSSEDGAFGGPTRVALGQAQAQAEQGHEVIVFAGAPREEASKRIENGVTIHTFPIRRILPFGRFATLWARGLRSALVTHAKTADIVHIHICRDLVTLPAALAMRKIGTPYVVQPHGMIRPTKKLLAKALDGVATRRALAGARVWLTLTEDESLELRDLATPRRIRQIKNGIHLNDAIELKDRPDLVLFLARLQERKRPLTFVEVAKLLGPKMPTTKFVIAGPDEGEGESVQRAIEAAELNGRLEWIGAVRPSDTRDLMASARVYVLPSLNEVFPMTILEAFSVGTPVVATSSLGIAETCRKYNAAIITDGSAEALADAVFSAHRQGHLAASLRQGAFQYIAQELSMTQVVLDLLNEYTAATRSAR